MEINLSKTKEALLKTKRKKNDSQFDQIRIFLLG